MNQRSTSYPAGDSNLDEVTVQSAIRKPMSVGKYAALVRRRRRFMACYLIFAVVLFAFVVLVLGSEAQIDFSGECSATRSAARCEGIFRDALFVMTFLMYAPLFLLSGIGAIAFRNRAIRILLLRPFDEKQLAYALKRFVVKQLGRTGLVFTLADRNYKPNLIARIAELFQFGPGLILYLIVAYVFGPALHNSRRIARVTGKFKFRALADSLRQNIRMNYWSLLSGDAGFNIRSANDWWQRCVHLLMNSCEIVVIDLSNVKEGMIWEINQLQAKGILEKCLFIVNEANAAHANVSVRQHFHSDKMPMVHVYSAAGRMKDRTFFEQQLDPILQAGLSGGSVRSATLLKK